MDRSLLFVGAEQAGDVKGGLIGRPDVHQQLFIVLTVVLLAVVPQVEAEVHSQIINNHNSPTDGQKSLYAILPMNSIFPRTALFLHFGCDSTPLPHPLPTYGLSQHYDDPLHRFLSGYEAIGISDSEECESINGDHLLANLETIL
jgi:hypothetical protein